MRWVTGIPDERAALPWRVSAAAVALATALAAATAAAVPFGVNGHVPGPELLDRIAASGARWVRVDVLWSWVEPAPDRFDWQVYDDLVAAAEARGLRLYATLADTPAWATDGPAGRGVPANTADWYDLCYRAASRYRGRIDYWGIWNEPNDARFWAGSRADYIDVLLKPGAAAIHAASASARVCGPELAHLESGHWDSWLRDVLKSASADLDVVTHHLYPDGSSSRSVVDMLAKGSPYFWDPPSVRKVLADAGWLGRPFWLTETGCSSGSTASGAQSQASFVGALSAALFGPERSLTWVHKVFFYEIADDPRYAWAALGLLGPPPEYREKPAYDELRRVTAALPVDDAEVVRVDLPDWLPPGAAGRGAVHLRNVGTTTWSSAGGYRLAATGSGLSLAAAGGLLADHETVAPGASHAFLFDIVAPAEASLPGAPLAGLWQMIREGRWRFGETAAAAVAVGEGGRSRAWLMPFAAAGTDAGGVSWSSDLVLHNRGSIPLTASVSFLAAGDDNAFPRTTAVRVPSGGIVVLDDVVSKRLGAAGSGALRIEAPTSALLASAASRTDPAPWAGAAIARAQRAEHAIPAGGEGRLLRLGRADGGSTLRSDLVLLNGAVEAAEVDVELVGDGGAAPVSLAFELAPGEVRIVDDVLAIAGIAAARHAQAIVRPQPQAAAVHAWALRIASGAALEVATAVAATDEPMVLAPVTGGSRLRGGAWRTDVQLVNPDAWPAVVVLELLAPAGVGAPAREVEVPARGSLVIEDALAALFSYRGSGALLVTPRSGRVAAAAGTSPARSAAGVGRSIQPLPLGEAVGEGGECRLFPVTRNRSTPGVRTHAEVVNLTGAPVTLRVQLLNETGVSLRVLPVHLAPREYRQLADVLRVSPSVDGGATTLVLTPITAGARVAASATVVPAAGSTATYVPCS